MSLVDPLVLHLIGSHPKVSPVILRHLQFAGFLDHILEMADAAACKLIKEEMDLESSIGKQSESAGNFPSSGKPSAGVLQLSSLSCHREPT